MRNNLVDEWWRTNTNDLDKGNAEDWKRRDLPYAIVALRISRVRPDLIEKKVGVGMSNINNLSLGEGWAKGENCWDRSEEKEAKPR